MTATLSEILDAVGSLLTEDQKDQLAAQLIGSQLKLVQPGDLITADYFNNITANIADLAIRVSALEGVTGGPVIDHIEPQGIDLSVGSLMTIVGQNFHPGNSDTIAYIDTVAISAFNLGSDPNRLIFTVPDSFAQLPRVAQVKVKVGDATSNSVSVGIEPEVQTQSGVLAVKSVGPALGTITIGTTYSIVWQVIPAAKLPGNYTFTPLVTDVNGATLKAWTDNIQVGQPGPIQIAPGIPLLVTMTIKVPANAVSANISLAGTSDDAIVKGAASPIAFIIGAQAEQSDDRAAVKLQAIPPIFNGSPNTLKGATISGVSGVTLPKSAASELPLELSIKAGDPSAQGFYKFRVVVEGETARWTVGTPNPVSQANVTSANRPTIKIPIQSTSVADTTTVSNIVVYAEKYTNQGDPQPAFKSFVRFPIKGA
jgi:hypothetical protein